MGFRHARRRTVRKPSIECLEQRQVMSADPLGGVLIHDPLVAMPIELHSSLQSEPPALVHHTASDADFWLDPLAERDTDALLGDIEQMLAGADALTGLTQVRNDYGFIGTGQTVVVIDSGIAWNHPALGNGLGANYRVVGGWDFAENDADPYDDGPLGAHGTLVSGVVGADRAGTADDGVASGVDLVGVRVFDDAGNSYYTWIENALQWVHQNRNAFENPITAVNLSLGTTAWNSNTIPSWATLENEFAQLEADGIFITVSAGNAFVTYNAPGLSYPAASPYVVPVMSVDDDGAFTYYSQRHTRAIAAPGRSIVSTIPDYAGNQNGVADDYASYSGTSMSAPYVAGASVLVREAMQFVGTANITQDTIFDHMMATADQFYDSATSQWYKRLNMQAAIDALMPTDDYGSTIATALNLGTLSGASQINGLIGKLTDADYFQFTASTTGTVTFTASPTDELDPVWIGSGTTSGANNEIYALQVVAGQVYTVGLSTGGGIGYYNLAIVSGGASSNQAPVLAAIGNKTVNEGSLLSFTATASDADSGQTRTFSLGAGAPTGATINATTGVFSWTPTESQGVGTYNVTVRVTDNGSPALSDFETISITVNEVNVSAGAGGDREQDGQRRQPADVHGDGHRRRPAGQYPDFQPGCRCSDRRDDQCDDRRLQLDPDREPGRRVSYNVTVRVTDNGSPALSDSETISITVNEVNVAPVLAAIGNRTVNEAAC